MTFQVTSHQRFGPGQVMVINDLIGVNVRASGLTGWDFNNAGTIIIDVSQPYIVVGMNFDFGSFHENSVFTNEATGIFRVISRSGVNPTFGLAAGHFGAGWNGDLVNAGLFEVMAVGYAAGVFTFDRTFKLNNSGTYRVTSTDDFAVGSWATNGGDYVNVGQIDVQGVRAYGLVLEKFGSIINGGDIRVRTTGPDPSVGVVVRSFEPDIIRIENTGLIEADIAILDQSFLYTPVQDARQEVFNSGVIRGSVDLRFGDDELVNAGLIDGRVDLGVGDDLYDGATGRTTDIVAGGAGADRLIGGASRDVLIGNDGDDHLTGGGGDDILGGGRGADRIDGGAGVDTVVFGDLSLGVQLDLQAGTTIGAGIGTITGVENAIGSDWADVLRGNSAANSLFGAEGGDALDGRDGADLLHGQAGNDILTGGGGADIFVFEVGGGHDVITDFQPGTDRLHIHGYEAWREIRQDGADVLVVLSDGDSIRLSGVTVSAFVNGNHAFMSGPAPEVDAPDIGGTVTRFESLRVNSDEATVAGEVLVFRNVSTAIIVGSVYQPGGVVFDNGARIDIAGSPEASSLVGLSSAGTDSVEIVNTSSGYVEVRASGATVSAYGVLGGSPGAKVQNLGTIDVSSEYDAFGIANLNWSITYVTNAGTIRVDGDGRGVGISAGQWASVTNSGLIEVLGARSATGIAVTSNTPTVINSGTIVVSSLNGTAVGIDGVFGRLSVDNSGVVEADIAIRSNFYHDVINNTGSLFGDVFLSGGDDLLQNSGRIIGAIDLGEGTDRYEGSLSNHAAAVDGGSGDDYLLGGQVGDSLHGGSGADIIHGGGGGDVLHGGAGHDLLDGGDGDDILIANEGNDVVRGGTGTDVLQVFGGRENYRLVISGDDFILKGPDGRDYISGVEYIQFEDGQVWDIARMYTSGSDNLSDDIDTKDKFDEALVMPRGAGASYIGPESLQMPANLVSGYCTTTLPGDEIIIDLRSFSDWD